MICTCVDNLYVLHKLDKSQFCSPKSIYCFFSKCNKTYASIQVVGHVSLCKKKKHPHKKVDKVDRWVDITSAPNRRGCCSFHYVNITLTQRAHLNRQSFPDLHLYNLLCL